MSHINFYTKSLGQRSAGKPHAALDAAGAGNVSLGNAPVFDPTYERLRGAVPLVDSPEGLRVRFPGATRLEEPDLMEASLKQTCQFLFVIKPNLLFFNFLSHFLYGLFF